MPTDEYTEQDRHNEGCCWAWQRDQCKGQGCLCVCHAPGEPERATYFDLVREIEGYRQRSRDEDTARIRLNAARIKAEAERDALAGQVERLREALGEAVAGLTNLSELRILTGQYRIEADALAERGRAALAAAGGDGQG